jgi:multicomponent Na+:H+ antiporter subunit E
MEIKPCLIFTRPHIRSVIGRVLFANSITLTPGTITAGLTKQGCWIHALTIEMAEKTKESALALQIREMEGEEE